MREIDWRSLRGAMVVLAGALTTGAAAVGGAKWFHDDALHGFARQKGMLESARTGFRTIDEQRRLIESRLPEFRKLQEAGVIGEERRLEWIETLRAAAARARLPSLRYRIERRTPHETGFGLDAGDYRLFSTVVHLEAGLLHEGDFERLVGELASQAAGLVRIDRCEIRRSGPEFSGRPGAINLVAECELRWLTLARVGKRT